MSHTLPRQRRPTSDGRRSVGTTSGKPTMLALDAANGKQLWSYAAGTSVNAGPAVVDGNLYWGSGDSNFLLGDAGNVLYSFSR